MDALEFAKAMIRYEELHREMKSLEKTITDYVSEREESQMIGNVKAHYRAGRTSYDYEATVFGLSGVTVLHPFVQTHKKVKTTYDWKSICMDEFKVKKDAVIIKNQPVPYVKIEVV